MIFQFDTNEQVRTLPLELLKESRSILDFKGRATKSRPVEPSEFITTVAAMCNENRILHNLEDIYVDKNYSRPTKRGQSNVTYDIGDWLFERVLTRIAIHDGNDEFNSAIAINYNERGISLAYGTNVKICQNMSILNRSHCINTYGTDRETYDRMLIILNSWLQNMPQHSEENFNKLIAMKKKKVKQEEVIHFLGQLYYNAQVKNSDDPKIEIAFGLNQLSHFTKDLIKQDVKSISTVYDLYNVGTNVLKPERCEFINISQSNLEWGEIIQKRFITSN